ncbi:MAG: hypothetical protein V1824_00010 [archaeon]
MQLKLLKKKSKNFWVKHLFKRGSGQAAITDALFFLTIIVTLSVLMFRFSSTYGDRIETATSNLYFKDYSNSALRTIFYTSIPLNYDLNLDSTQETDNLMTAIKEDYFPDGKIGTSEINSISTDTYGDIVKFNLYHTIKAVMQPMPNYDYVFYMLNTSTGNFDFFVIKLTNFVKDDSGHYLGGKVVYDIDETKSYSYMLCDPDDYPSVRNIISKGNLVFSSSTPLVFYKGDNSEQNNLTVTFAIWPANASIKKEDLLDETSSTLHCKLIPEDIE